MAAEDPARGSSGGGYVGQLADHRLDLQELLQPEAAELAAVARLLVALDYSVQAGPGTLSLNGNLYYNSGFFPESDNAIKQDRYAQLGANIRYEFDDGLSISAFGKNLTDRRVINFETTIPFGIHTGFYQAPRTYGVAVGYKF